MPERYRRFDSPLDADQELIDATLNILVAEGADAVSLIRLAEELQRELDDLQELFGHPGELLAQLWQAIFRQSWIEISHLARRLFDGDLSAIDEVLNDVPHRRAAVHLVVVAHRYEELAEVIPNDLHQLMASLGKNMETLEIESSPPTINADRSVMLGLLGWIVGAILEPLENRPVSLQQLVDNNFHHRCWKTDFERDEGERLSPQLLLFDQAGPLSGEVLAASTQIVAKGGVSRATLARVARVSGYPPEVVIGMYMKQENLLADFVDRAVSSIFGYKSIRAAVFDISNAAMRLSVWLESPQAIRRQALLEVLVAGSHSAVIRDAYTQTVQKIDAVAGESLESGHNDFNSHFERYAAIIRQTCFGTAVISEAIGELGVEDWRPFVQVALSSDLHSRIQSD